MNARTRTRRVIGGIATAVAAVLALAGCSGADAGSAPEGGGGKTDITVLHAPINYEPLYLAQQQGFFAEVGLQVTITPGGTAQDNLGQLAGGSADLAMISWDSAVTATAEGIPIKVVSNNAIISSAFDTSGIVVRADSGIASVADLAGRTIAFNSVGSGGNVPVLQALKDAGVDPASVQQVAIPYASMQASLQSGQVDAIFPSDSFYAAIQKEQGFTTIAHPARDYRAGLGITLWSATEQWLADNPGTAAKFNEAMGKAIEFYNDPANVQAVYEVRAQVTGRPVAEVQGRLLEFSLETDPIVSQATTDALAEFGLVQSPKTVDEILWSEAPRKP